MKLSDLHDRATITVPEAGEVLGLSRKSAYLACDRGDIPTLRLGRRLVVPVPKLLALIGADPPNGNGPGGGAGAAEHLNGRGDQRRVPYEPT